MNSKVAHPLKVANRRLGCVIPAAPAHGWPISHLHRFALTALIYAAAMLLLTSANAESRRAAAGGTEEPTSSTPSDRDEEAKRSFLEKYAKASERLEAGLSRLHARGHVRRFNARKKPTEEGATLEFFAKDGKRRVNIDYGSSQERPADTNAAPSETMLLTPETAALVTDPGTEFAFARHLSVKPDLGFERQFAGKAWCFVEASHLALDCLANGGCVLESVERDPEHAGLYHTRVLIGPKGQQTMDVWLDLNQA